MLPVYLEIFPNAQLLHIIRDEADVAASLSSRAKKGIGTKNDPEYWKELRRHYIARAREFGAKHQSYYELSYEDFCTRPVAVMSHVCKSLGLELADSTREFLETRVYRHRIGIGNPSQP